MTDSGVTYAEIRMWARWLDTFTASDLADAMGVAHDIGVKGVRALVWHGIVEDTGDELDTLYGREPIIAYIPPPRDAPREHPSGPKPEILAVMEMGGWLLFDRRGLPVRLRTERDTRRSLSTPGARQHHRNQERQYQRQEQARLEAEEKSRRRQEREAQQNIEWRLRARKRLATKGLY